MTIHFTIPGKPQGKARPRTVRLPNGAVSTYTPKGTRDYEKQVRERFKSASDGFCFTDGSELAVEIVAGFPIPHSTPKKCRYAMAAGAIRPTKRPDFDNIAKIICDALNGVAYKDDAQIVTVKIEKRYVEGDGGTSIKITDEKGI